MTGAFSNVNIFNFIKMCALRIVFKCVFQDYISYAYRFRKIKSMQIIVNLNGILEYLIYFLQINRLISIGGFSKCSVF